MCPHMAEGTWGTPFNLFYKGTNAIHEGGALTTNHLLEAPPFHTDIIIQTTSSSPWPAFSENPTGLL